MNKPTFTFLKTSTQLSLADLLMGIDGLRLPGAPYYPYAFFNRISNFVVIVKSSQVFISKPVVE
jgi:hypothetical protein